MATGTGEAMGPVPKEIDLEQLIAQRKAAVQQEAKMKQLKDFKTIARANWNNSNGLHPLQLLPKEMWHTVLSNLRDPRDLENAMLCCPLFSDLLEPRRISDILLPLVMEVSHFQDEFKSGMKQVTPLRLVSKAIRDAVDDNLMGISTNIRYDGHDERKYELLRRTLAPYDPSADPNPASRLPVTYWVVHVEHVAEDGKEHFTSFCELLKTTLRLVGDQLLMFGVVVDRPSDLLMAGVTMTDFYVLVHDLVSLMPNLKGLDIHFIVNFDIEPEPESRFDHTLRSKPFPTIPSLVEFGCLGRDVPHELDIFDAVITANPQLTKLTLMGNKDATEGFMDKVKALPLKTLILDMNFDDKWDYLEKFARPRPNWNLTDISVTFNTCTVSVGKLFQFLEQFQELEELSLGFHEVDIECSDEMRSLRLPKLKVFKFGYNYDEDEWNANNSTDQDSSILVNNDFTLSLDYLVMAEPLLDVAWSNEVVHRKTNRGRQVLEPIRQDVIQFNGGTANLFESNVWDVFPSLTAIEVLTHASKRVMNMYYRNEKQVEVVKRIHL